MMYLNNDGHIVSEVDEAYTISHVKPDGNNSLAKSVMSAGGRTVVLKLKNHLLNKQNV